MVLVFLKTNQVFKLNNDVNTRATDPSKKFKAGPKVYSLNINNVCIILR